MNEVYVHTYLSLRGETRLSHVEVVVAFTDLERKILKGCFRVIREDSDIFTELRRKKIFILHSHYSEGKKSDYTGFNLPSLSRSVEG